MFKKYLKFNSYQRKYFSSNSDILIVGGGVPGLSLAAALIKNDYFKNNITIIDQPLKLKDDFLYKKDRLPDIRVISLTPASVRFFKSIGLWSILDERLIKYVKGIQVYENKGSSFLHMNTNDTKDLSNLINYLPSFIPKPIINEEFSFALIEINHLIHGLQILLKDKINIINHNLQIDNIEIEQNTEYTNFRMLKEGIDYETQLLIASDGSKSVIRNKLNISTFGYDYNETGLVCTLRGNVSSDIAYQRFLHNGVFALLPLYDNLYSIVCSMPKNINENLKNLNENDFLNVINKILHDPSEYDLSFLDRLSSSNNLSCPPVITELLSKRIEFPLQLQYVNNNVHDNCIIIGDAAHSIHPMAGQGMNLGIADSAILSNEIISGIMDGKRLNEKRMLDNFSYKSQMNYKSMIGSIEALKILYKPENSIISAIRNIGSSVINKSSYIKGILMLAASGNLNLPEVYAWDKLL